MTEKITNNSRTGKICVSIGNGVLNAALTAASNVGGQADVIEIRLDALSAPQVRPFLAKIKVPLLFTNRPAWEGGSFKGTEAARLEKLRQAAEHGAAYIDIELLTEAKMRRELMDRARDHQCRPLVSWHNFSNTPPDRELEEILARQYDSGAAIGKIVTMAHDFTDVLRVLRLQLPAREKQFPLCAFCMGEAGKISRLATLALGGYMTYAAPDRAARTAPGQFDLDSLGRILEIINGN